MELTTAKVDSDKVGFFEVDNAMTSLDLKNLSRTLGDLVAHLKVLVDEFVQLTQAQQLNWARIHALGHEICDLSQWIHLELSAQRQRQAKLSSASGSLMQQFALSGEKLLAQVGEEVVKTHAPDLKDYICHVGRRVALVAEMDRRWEASSASAGTAQISSQHAEASCK